MNKQISEVMSSPCITATLLDNVYELAVLMKKHDIGFIPIIEDSKLIGVVTDRDLVVRGYADKHSGSTAVEKVMTADFLTITPDATVADAAELMARHQIRRLPVVESGRLVGVVALGDLAVRDAFIHEAGAALNEISEHIH
ncbi:CBS domain-containing protein [Paenibacillus glycanilyticus]|uniref:CBS domain-containing protein n=1 Tax=Paenibacillus glycanilyticus TaxID=126569 RepID=UPI0024E12ABF|nr:CBS domain-containing protein [Paenibacillus glycanilyticus]